MIRRGHLILLFMGCLVSMLGCADRLDWRSDWKVAMAEARRDRLGTLMMFSAATCPRCWHMDRKVFTNPRVRRELADYKLVRVDMLTHSKMARQYGFTGTPSFVAFDSMGRVIGTRAGAMDAPMLVRFLQRSRMNR